jgi:hypothetical protein
MTGLAWAETDQGTWAASIGDTALFVSRLAGTGEWTWRVRFPDGREVTARHPYLIRRTAQAAAERAAAEQ